MVSSETVYTFSLTFDWFHTVNAVALTSTAVDAPIRRNVRSGEK
jgi:hypothetical protein